MTAILDGGGGGGLLKCCSKLDDKDVYLTRLSDQ